MVFSFTWNATFETQPADTEALSLGAGRIRDLKAAISERGEIDHNWDGGVDDGQHKKITFGAPLGAHPTNAANLGFVYTKDVSAKVELHWIDEDGNVIILTSGGSLSAVYLGINLLTEEAGITTGDWVPFWDTTANIVRKVNYEDLVILSRGSIDGLILSNNSTDAIDVSDGQCRNGADTANMELSAALTNKQLSSVWAVGPAAGMLDTGSEAADSWYHIWLIRRSDTGVVDVLASLSATAPSMPTNYDQKRRIGAVLTDATPDIIAFIQRGDYFFWKSRVQELASADAGTSQTLLAVTVPTGIKVMANIMARAFKNSSAQYLISSPQHDNNVPSTSDYDLKVNNYQASIEVFRETDTSARIGYRASVASASLDISILGWIDPRGRDA